MCAALRREPDRPVVARKKSAMSPERRRKAALRSALRARPRRDWSGQIREKVSPPKAARVQGDAGESGAVTCVRQIGEYMTTRAEANALGAAPRGSIAPFPLRCARKTARVYPSRSMKAAAGSGSGSGADRRERLGGGRPLRSLRVCAAAAAAGVCALWRLARKSVAGSFARAAESV